jgi:hypothetical protein
MADILTAPSERAIRKVPADSQFVAKCAAREPSALRP